MHAYGGYSLRGCYRDDLVHSNVICVRGDVAMGHRACNLVDVLSETTMGLKPILVGAKQVVCLMWCHPGPLPGACSTNNHVSILEEMGRLGDGKVCKVTIGVGQCHSGRRIRCKLLH